METREDPPGFQSIGGERPVSLREVSVRTTIDRARIRTGLQAGRLSGSVLPPFLGGTVSHYQGWRVGPTVAAGWRAVRAGREHLDTYQDGDRWFCELDGMDDGIRK